jgi:hypothetical protein
VKAGITFVNNSYLPERKDFSSINRAVLCSSSGIGSCRDTRSEDTRNSNGVIQPQLRKRAIKGPVGVKIEHI